MGQKLWQDGSVEKLLWASLWAFCLSMLLGSLCHNKVIGAEIDIDTGQVDLSYLNSHKAGDLGAIKVDGDHFVYSKTGATVRFWGCNVAAYAIFDTSKRNIERQARRLAMYGYNLVRLHHMDSGWVSGQIWNDDGTLNAASMDKLDYWIYQLAENGIYSWVDLHVGLRLPFDRDKWPLNDEMQAAKFNGSPEPGTLKGFCYFDPVLQAKMAQNEALVLGHVNPYTGWQYHCDPAIAFLTLTNENDVRHSRHMFRNAKKFPQLNALYRAAAEAWAEEQNYTLHTGKAFTLDDVLRDFGKPAFLFWAELEHDLTTQLLGSTEMKPWQRMIHKPFCTTNMWGSNPYANVPSLTEGSFIDVHDYGTGANLLEADLSQGTPNLAARIGAYQVAGMPLTVSEWSTPAKKEQTDAERYAYPLWMATIARLQGWDGMCLYCYSQAALPPAAHWNIKPFGVVGDPSWEVMLPAAALAYRVHCREAIMSLNVHLADDELISGKTYKNNLPAITQAEQSRITVSFDRHPVLPWLAARAGTGATSQVAGLDVSLIDGMTTQVTADHGEHVRHWDSGFYSISAPRTKAIVGRIGTGALYCNGGLRVKSSEDCGVVVSSLDSKATELSDRCLISAIGSSVHVSKTTTWQMAPLVGEVHVRTQATRKVYTLAGDEVPSTWNDGWLTWQLSNEYWWEVR